MKNSSIYYSVGPLLYCPANRDTIAASIISEKFGSHFSLALCLEDTISDLHVAEAEHSLAASIRQISQAAQQQSFYLPKIFVRVREPGQIARLLTLLGPSQSLLNGFIIPKFAPDLADAYIQAMTAANEQSPHPLYLMPIYESACMIDLRSRYDILYALKEKLSHVEDLVLNIRVGGNDLCHLFSFRRHACESIHRIRPVADLFSDLITVYGMDYVVSGPVFEYYNGKDWKEGLEQELAEDRLCGFIGKTVIHPNQIASVNDAYRIPQKDYADACRILNWDPSLSSCVAANASRERMNEQKTHTNWARQILRMAEVFGVWPDQK